MRGGECLERGDEMLVGYFTILWWWLVKNVLFKTVFSQSFLMVTAGLEFDSCPQDFVRKILHRFKGKGAKLLGFAPKF